MAVCCLRPDGSATDVCLPNCTHGGHVGSDDSCGELNGGNDVELLINVECATTGPKFFEYNESQKRDKDGSTANGKASDKTRASIPGYLKLPKRVDWQEVANEICQNILRAGQQPAKNGCFNECSCVNLQDLLERRE